MLHEVLSPLNKLRCGTDDAVVLVVHHATMLELSCSAIELILLAHDISMDTSVRKSLTIAVTSYTWS